MAPGLDESIRVNGGVFKTYKEKVVHILKCCVSQLEEESPLSYDLNWCLHVIKNDFLQISNSIQNSTVNVPGSAKGRVRRFSKT